MKMTIRVPRPAAVIAWLLVTFLVLFPKGGIKAGPLPLTWGYLLLGLLFFPLLALRVLNLPIRQSYAALLAFGSLVPFQILFCYSYFANGVDNGGYATSLATGFFFLPAIFLGIFPAFLRRVDPCRFQRQFCFCIFAAALWGIFLFFYHPLMGKYIEIPYLTVNAADYGQLEATKHIARGGYLKLIATYNNGNLYGVATLILLPLYLLLEPALWKRNTVRIALVLTLSRTVWFGLILEQILSLMVQLPVLVARFPRIRPGKVTRQAAVVLATGGLVLTGLLFNSAGLAFLADASFGGRLNGQGFTANPTLLPVVPLTGLSELLYASALRNYGVLGLCAILLIFCLPLLLIAMRPDTLRIPSRRAAAKGLILYAIVAGIDAAVMLIPVMAFYWFGYMTMLFGLPGQASAGEQAVPRLSPDRGRATGDRPVEVALN